MFLASRLKERIQIRKINSITPNDEGGFNRSYSTLLTIWAGFRPLSGRTKYIRGEQTEFFSTHEFTIRRSAVGNLGKAFSSAFDTNFDCIADLNPLKSDYFIFVQRGSTVKGRLFRINDIEDVNERKEYLIVLAEEIEEVGSGFNE